MKAFSVHQIFLYVAIVVLAFLLFRQCDRTQELKQDHDVVVGFINDTVEFYKNELGQEIAQKEVLQGSKANLEILLSEKIDSLGQLKRLVKNFRNVNVAGNVTTITVVDSIPVPYEVPVPVDFSRDFEKVTEHYSLSGISTNHGLTINNLALPNTLSFAIGDRKTGLFRSQYRIETVNSNPYVTTTGLDSYVLTSNKGLLSIGAQAGYGLTLHGPSPYVGAGINLDLWAALKALFR